MTSEVTGPKPLLVLGKITDILDAFTLQRPVLSLGEIQQATGIPTSTVQRLVSNMVTEGLLDRVGDRVRVGVRMAYWAGAAARGVDLLDLAGPVLRELRDTTGETAALFRAETRFRVCVAVAETRHALRREMHVGKIIPLHTGSAGRVLLAWDAPLADEVLSGPLETITDHTVTDPAVLRTLVDETRRDGFAITAAERDDGGSGLSAPVFDHSGAVAAALTISGPTIRLTRERCEQHVELLVRAADRLTRTLGGRPPS
ncbi:Transcriptional regulator, IclR family [Pseudonocardia sp. Ae168_Ps1]|jgi:DNA-binding IclR family transcriptional regulator|uniref:IclR family transcriptional regulator n=1 Tax=unclassified Pseudonocardia TaxID=2619320 RepID=UPI0001FFE1D0|nr:MULTISPECIES: IclR family transcriptional regulator [unclassified Pseudonocardia]OLL72788.1 Transcriptional regulator, IclR family [Pseudonocardia sp. Ae150A_Ps1]OLL78762.1 Transcriptional regulator, IclR family [Pseudonocardia sp. Ae168_Ps1]OLL87111.1 Transcriptional regulator, IclR family [Pseudonocardia sp. Ae263_Ps1]OLL92859.1 Transcriptional regulator, IclR family [Pseudonocardia sp. Ae356_Ps1]OLM19337.1 Transcriptional regulator, IclR family [Pseudonocardia sp. Ae707_Ps1]